MIVKPLEIDDVLYNPWMGWGLWSGLVAGDGSHHTIVENTTGFEDDAPLFQWMLIDWMWADLEPQEGHFFWDDLETVLNYWVARGKQINLRVWVTDDPGWNRSAGLHKVCPDWVYDAGLRSHDYSDEAGVLKREPDYADSSFQTVLIPRLKNLLAALADRYDKPGNPFNFISNFGYGQWGEWHTLLSNYYWPSKEIKHAVLAQLINLYADTFKHIDLAVSYCIDTYNIGEGAPYLRLLENSWSSFRDLIARDNVEDFKYRQAMDVALGRGYLLGRHGFIDGLEYVDKVIMQQEWQRTAFYAEANWNYADTKNHGTHGTIDENIDVMLDWHSTYAHFYSRHNSYSRFLREDADTFGRALRSGGFGYRLVLTEAAYPDLIAPDRLFLLHQKWANRNVARCYKRHPLKLYLTDAAGNTVYEEADRTFDQTSWIRGQSYDWLSIFHLPAGLPEGTYDVRIALVDLEGNPKISLGIAGGDLQKRYRLGTVLVK